MPVRMAVGRITRTMMTKVVSNAAGVRLPRRSSDQAPVHRREQDRQIAPRTRAAERPQDPAESQGDHHQQHEGLVLWHGRAFWDGCGGAACGWYAIAGKRREGRRRNARAARARGAAARARAIARPRTPAPRRPGAQLRARPARAAAASCMPRLTCSASAPSRQFAASRAVDGTPRRRVAHHMSGTTIISTHAIRR